MPEFVEVGSEEFSPAADPWSVDGVASPGSDYILLIVLSEDATFVVDSPPSGFTYLLEIVTPADMMFHLYGGFAPSAPYSVGFTTTEVGGAAWMRYSGVNRLQPLDVTVQGTPGGASGTPVDTPFIYPRSPGCRIVGGALAVTGVAKTCTWDAGITERLDIQASGGSLSSFFLADKPWDGLGRTNLQGDVSAAGVHMTFTVALKPEPIRPNYTGYA